MESPISKPPKRGCHLSPMALFLSHVNRCYRVVPPRRDCVVFSLRANLLTFRKYSRCYNRYFEQKQRKVKKLNNIGGQLQMYPNLLNVLHLINQKWNTRTKCRLFSECRLTRMNLFLARNVLCYKSEIICGTSHLNAMS